MIGVLANNEGSVYTDGIGVLEPPKVAAEECGQIYRRDVCAFMCERAGGFMARKLLATVHIIISLSS